MSANIKPLVAGNWKMNGLRPSVRELEALAKGLEEAPIDVGIMVCPPATLLLGFSKMAADAGIELGGQDCHTGVSGANTGDLSPEMLADSGAVAVIVGHSERREDHGETDALVKAKAEAAHRAGITAIVCIGETAGQRSYGLTLDVVKRQLVNSMPKGASSGNTIIAYEPVWAIGTGLTPTVDDVGEVHALIRSQLGEILGDDAGSKVRILYGGSVKPANAKELMAVENVNGALVGGASLKADDFLGIIAAYR
jgi:triosephosphate isomerase